MLFREEWESINEPRVMASQILWLARTLDTANDPNDIRIPWLDNRKIKSEWTTKSYPCSVYFHFYKDKKSKNEYITVSRSFTPLYKNSSDGSWEKITIDNDPWYYDWDCPLTNVYEQYAPDFTSVVITKNYPTQNPDTWNIDRRLVFNYAQHCEDMVPISMGLKNFNPHFNETQLNTIIGVLETLKTEERASKIEQHIIIKELCNLLNLDNKDHDYTMRFQYLFYELNIFKKTVKEEINNPEIILRRLWFINAAFLEFKEQKDKRIALEVRKNFKTYYPTGSTFFK